MPAYGGSPYAGGSYAGPALVGAVLSPPGSLATPTLRIELGFDAGPFGSPTWVTVSEHHHDPAGIVIRRGVTADGGYTTVGTCELTFRNDTRVLDASNTAGIYYGRLKARNWLRVTKVVGGVDYVLFTGYIPRWPQTYNHARRALDVRVRAVDVLGLLQNRDFAPARPWTLDDPSLSVLDDPTIVFDDRRPWLPKQLTGVRMRWLLNYIGVPNSMLDIDDGTVECAAGQVDTDRLGPYLAKLAATELGELSVRADGTIRFLERLGWTQRNQTRTSQIVLSDDLTDTGASPFLQLGFDPTDDRWIVNEAVRTTPSGLERSATDWSSIDEHGRQTENLDLLYESELDAANHVAWKIRRYAAPQTQIQTVTIDPRIAPAALYPSVYGLDIGAQITVEFQPAGAGTAIVQDSRIAQIEHRLKALDSTTTWRLEPVDDIPYWILDDPVRSVIDSIYEFA